MFSHFNLANAWRKRKPLMSAPVCPKNAPSIKSISAQDDYCLALSFCGHVYGHIISNLLHWHAEIENLFHVFYLI